jgi:Flp pilus assembly protein TadG
MVKRLKTLRCEDGQAIVELAFVIPLVLLFLFGIIDFGLALNTQNSDTNLANLAARQVSVIGSTTSENCNGHPYTDLQSWATCMAPATGTSSPTVCVADISTSQNTSTYVTGDPIKVVVKSNFSWLKLLTDKVAGLQSTISGSATMRMENAPTGGSNSFLTSDVCPVGT